jgi:hypothetical protein
MRSKLSGVQIPTAAKLNIDGEFTLDASAGAPGQVLTSAGAGNTPTWASIASGAMNYAQTQATKQSTISASGVTIVSASITTTGYPVQVLVTGDAENSTAGGWIKLQLYRDSTAIGKIVQVESSAGSENIPYALTVIDAPVAGTYTYSLKTASAAAAGTFNFGETDGPVLTAIELRGVKGDAGTSFTGGTLTSSLTLRSGTATAGTAPLYFGTSTPALLTTPIPGAIEYDGVVHYATPENNSGTATAGRSLIASPHTFVTTLVSMDFSTSAAAQTMLSDGVGTNTTRGITLLAGTSYEFEMYFGLRYQSFGDTTTSLNLGWTRTTVSGTPTTTIQSWLDYGNNTTSFATATTLSSIIGSETTTTNFTSPGATGSRYITWKGRGIIRVTGTGSVKIYPSITPTAGTANVPSVSTNSYFKITPIGNGTVQSVGAFN